VTLTLREAEDGFAGRQVVSDGAEITVPGRRGPARSAILDRASPYGAIQGETRELRILFRDLAAAGWTPDTVKIGTKVTAAGDAAKYTIRARVANERTGIFLAVVEKDAR